ncbi:hypothetical protein ACA910_017228 [Epithemia clementina (nom. ined.)]
MSEKKITLTDTNVSLESMDVAKGVLVKARWSVKNNNDQHVDVGVAIEKKEENVLVGLFWSNIHGSIVYKEAWNSTDNLFFVNPEEEDEIMDGLILDSIPQSVAIGKLVGVNARHAVEGRNEYFLVIGTVYGFIDNEVQLRLIWSMLVGPIDKRYKFNPVHCKLCTVWETG